MARHAARLVNPFVQSLTRAAHPPASQSEETRIGFPRFFNIGGYWINAYKFFLIVGIYIGSLASAALGQSAGQSPLRVGLAAMGSALLGLVGARVYHLAVHARYFFRRGSRHLLWDVRRGGWGVFGALITFVPASFAAASFVGQSPGVLWDFMSGGVLAGGFWIRLGCVLNGCCVGRETGAWWGVHLHDVRGTRKSRAPVQYLEMLWWLLGGVAFLLVWPTPLPSGGYALAVLAWYGVGRFLLEPMREQIDRVWGVAIDQLIAGLLAIACGSVLALRLWLR